MQGILGNKILAVASGKGGVGKSTTSVNIGLIAAREGLRTALVDVDPLSDLAVILDIDRNRMEALREDLGSTKLSDYTLPLFPRLDLLFPRAKLKKGDPDALRDLLFGQFAKELDARYDLLVFDMPAGIGADENLSFVPFFEDLVLVCNPEPTSHVSGGGYIKAVREINNTLRIRLWHNKFGLRFDEGFDSRNLPGNYNRMVPEDLRLDARDLSAIENAAFIPHDFSLDLLRADSPYHYVIYGRLEDCLKALDELLVAPLAASLAGERLALLARHYTLKQYPGLKADEFLAFCAQVGGVGSVKVDEDQKRLLARYFAVQQAHPLRPHVRKLLLSLENVRSLIHEEAVFAGKQSEASRKLAVEQKALFQALARFIDRLSSHATTSRPPWPQAQSMAVIKMGGLVLAWAALLQLAALPSMHRLIARFIPHKKNRSGHTVRDRHAQIRLLVEKDGEYHQKYFALIKETYPHFLALIQRYGNKPSWKKFTFANKDDSINSNAYLKLYSLALHDMINAGLGLTVGVKHNRCAKELQEGVRKLLKAKGHLK